MTTACSPNALLHNHITTTVLNEATGETIVIPDGYDFVFSVSDTVFSQIQTSCQIYGSTAYVRWVKEATAWILKQGFGIVKEESLALLTETDSLLFNETGQELVKGNYVTAGLSLLLTRIKLPGLRSFDDLLAIAKKTGVTTKGKAQFEIVQVSMREIFQELRKNGFKITGRKGKKLVFLKNEHTKETILIRKSKTKKYDTFDTISQNVNGVQTDIRIPHRR